LGIRIKSRPLTSHGRYLSLLGTKSLADLEESIVARVLDCVRALPRAQFPPVKLSKVVNNFDIEPIPRFDPSIPDGRLHFDSTQNRFLITLGRELRRSCGYNTADLFDPEAGVTQDRLLTRRLRFTYAHEVAHRFCYFEENGHWSRALRAATANRGPALTDRRRLELNEEQLCNRVAGRLLVPRDLLVEYIHQRLSSNSDLSVLDFQKEIRSAANLFEVSEDCLLVQLQRAAERDQLTLPSNLCAFSLRLSDRSGASQRAARTLRIQIALLPSCVDGVQLCRIFPGLAARHLGPAFSSWLCDLRKSGNKTRSGQLNVPITLHTNSDRPSSQLFTLSGWWKNNRTDTNSVLLWGFLGQYKNK